MNWNVTGLLWRTGYEDGSIKVPIYVDVFPAIRTWVREKGLKVMIYSSGSVAAQQLLFRYTDVLELENGDFTPYIAGYFDTVTAGMKQDKESYNKIAEETGIEPGNWLFLSDNVKGMYQFVDVGVLREQAFLSQTAPWGRLVKASSGRVPHLHTRFKVLMD